MSDTPSPFLRRLVAQKASVNDTIIDDLIDMSDHDLTRLLVGFSVPPHETPESIDGVLFDLSKKHNTSGYWVSWCVTARVLDRWLEENA